MWMRRGTQGHVTLPRGQARAPAWRRCDKWRRIFIFVYIVYDKMYIGLPIIERHTINPQCRHTLYTRDILLFLRCGTISPSLSLFQSDVAASRVSDRNQEKSRA